MVVLPSVVVSRTAQAAQLALLKPLGGNLNRSSYYPIANKAVFMPMRCNGQLTYGLKEAMSQLPSTPLTYFSCNSVMNICSLGLKNLISSILQSLGQKWGAR